MDSLTSILVPLGGAIALFILASLVQPLVKWIVGLSVKKFSKTASLSKENIKANWRIESALEDLQKDFNAIRVALFQFHNGNIFLLANHDWKITCTHECTAYGVTRELRNNNSILATSITDWIDPIITGEISRSQGVEVLSICEKCKGECPFAARGKKVYAYDVSSMRSSMSKFMAQEQGIERAYCVPIYGNNTNKKDEQTVIGFLSVQFRSDYDAKDIGNDKSLCKLCEVSEDIEVLISNK